jgi:hypothetical protein
MQKGIPALRQARYEGISDLPGIQKSYREKAALSISGDTTSNEDMCNVERRAQSSGVNSSGARTVTETATAYATNSTLNQWIGKDSSCRRPRGDNEIV